ncbi:MAG: ECF transporter S component [Clostridia bacterium]|nr:ECF transporter S component [Clostridia bacterium]
MKNTVKNTAFAGMFLALCMVLPMITGNIPEVGQMLCPMHVPVLLCGFVCGWPYGLLVGAIAPLLRSLIFGMPAMYPAAAAMAFELATYGLLTGVLYRVFPKKDGYIYPTLFIAMIGGRLVWGAARYIMAGLSGSTFGMQAFLAGALTNAIPGIILHIVIVPAVVIAFRRAKLMDTE